MEKLKPAVLLLLSLAVICCQGQSDPCNDTLLDSCDLCINKSPECVWCSLTEVTEALIADYPDLQNFRCRNRDSDLHRNMSCGTNETSVLQDPRSSSNITVDEALTGEAELGVPTVQVSPQNIVLKLRRGEPVTFPMTFRSLRNTPLDVYFLFDFSSSLSNVINTLRDNVITIADSLKNISVAYAIGLGTFVDKPTIPYSSNSNRMVTEEGDFVCRLGIPEPCVPAYGYRHSLSLVQDVDAFREAINASEISSNLDDIEGGLDAALQAIVCQDIVGWRSNALRMLFYVSDNSYHLAGDGRLSGSYRPNDGLCHLEKTVLDRSNLTVYEYTRSVFQDYPSVRQLRDAMIETNVVPIFVIRSSDNSAQRLLAPYNSLASTLSDVGANVRQLDRLREQDITELESVIRESYEQTTQRISPNDPGLDGYSFSFDPIDGCDRMEGGACTIEFGDNVVFNVTVTLDSCDDPSERDIQLVGPPFTFSAVTLVPQCSCECSDEPERGTDICSGFGQRICGVCICDTVNGSPVRYGDQCQCENRIKTCPQRDNMDCSGRGSCDVCGVCECDPGFFGDTCECEYSECPSGTINGTDLICSGRGDCICNNGREVCECDTALVTTVATYDYFSPTIPNNGNCLCDPNNCYNSQSNGLCATLRITEDNNIQYVNNSESCFCSGCVCSQGQNNVENICITEEQSCMRQIMCARCSVQETQTSDCVNCTLSNFITIGIDDSPPDEFRVMCEFEYSGCTYTFYLSAESATAEVLVSDDINCPLGALPWIIAGSIGGAILLLGLLALILLKFLFVFLDRIEYKRFTKELQQADFAPHENPLYLTPQQDYPNPLRRPSKKVTQ